MTEKYALVLTGELFPGYEPATVWPALAAYFRMEPDKLTGQLLARAPVTIKESEDLAKLQGLQSGINAAGAEAELHAADGGAYFALIANQPRGPMPLAFVADRVERGLWPADVSIAAVGSTTWNAYSATRPAAAAAAAVPPMAPAAPQPGAAPAPAAFAATPDAAPAAAGPVLSESGMLPAGLTIHGGFWRRTAAYLMDGFIIGVVNWVITMILMVAMVGSLAAGSVNAAFGTVALQALVGIVLSWLYFALQESSATQATLGKRAMGLKVTDDYARRIGFGRATGRFFGKILSSVIFNIGFMLAGWTGRRQALHDMICGTVVVFREVEPGRPLPATRPPMPWYGWVVNILMTALFVLAFFAAWASFSALVNL
ncbi:MAG TPA: RDD family protein [Dokdonella sp.]|uniref:RDD family protein n=1 Tax=Dokdonella sp. TaxID=2291710 RepID=UPI002BC47509|nr:RDD family protein [Dokdonella sp.]HUD41193.1 RDD family protein [Dokdonella sp.]